MHLTRLGLQRKKIGRGTERFRVVGARGMEGVAGGLRDPVRYRRPVGV
ncbi:hypothetical protein [Gordonia terrae]|nr:MULTISPECIES: hypothetical protein [Gordonia]